MSECFAPQQIVYIHTQEHTSIFPTSKTVTKTLLKKNKKHKKLKNNLNTSTKKKRETIAMHRIQQKKNET